MIWVLDKLFLYVKKSGKMFIPLLQSLFFPTKIKYYERTNVCIINYPGSRHVFARLTETVG